MPTVYVIATMDSKGEEAAFVRDAIRAAGVDAIMVDVGTAETPTQRPDISRAQVAASHPEGEGAVAGHADRGIAITAMAAALRPFLLVEQAAGRCDGVIGLGGSGGTALICPALQALPIGVPKAMVSTVASGQTRPYVGSSDIAMFNSVVDVAGINRVSKVVLGNAARAIAGMVDAPSANAAPKKTVAITMFGVTTPCVTQLRHALAAESWDCLVFHATGSGGQAMEKLVASQMVDGVIDVTTTEIADEVVGGVFSAGPARLDAIIDASIPYVVSLGALDMVNFGGLDTVPPHFRERRLHVHNAQVTLMRTNADENRRVAMWLAAKLNRSQAPVTILVPEGGLSVLDAPGQPFWDPAADAVLFDTLEAELKVSDQHCFRRLPHHINAPEFSGALFLAYNELLARTANA